jgi:hypothetical protein
MMLTKLLTRRFFLAGLSMSCLGYVFRRPAPAFSVRRIVHYPHPMTGVQFDKVSEEYCDHVAIQAFCRELQSAGRLRPIECTFHSDRVVYELVFRDRESYLHYVNTITENWFDPVKFAAMGFHSELIELS